ncbi:MAG: phage holin family protein [Acidobacteria bacterium]|jgi:flagellar motor component MotA|nr:phage holin family protein [Acidobacteriota bacterium]MBA4121656.1 phage holin family protein [Acidobacteriota bacterium]MBA4182792.1 phage holin family protein [Acidobacteriota bacterium]MDQ3710713.1 phage holin family protein [Acidobacteriota bacterium]
MAQQQIVKEERSLGDLFSELATETSTLVRQEVALAQTELTQKATSVGKNVGFLVVGGAVGYTALFVILAAVVIGLTQLISYLSGWQIITSAWIAAAVVGLIVGIVAYVLITNALAKLKNTELTPNQTVETLKEDAEWLKNQVS